MTLRNCGFWLSVSVRPSSFPKARKNICLQPLKICAVTIRSKNFRTNDCGEAVKRNACKKMKACYNKICHEDKKFLSTVRL